MNVEYPNANWHNILSDLMQNRIVDILVPSYNDIPRSLSDQSILAMGFRFKFNRSDEFYVTANVSTEDDNEYMGLSVISDLNILQYPCGPSVKWDSIYALFNIHHEIVLEINVKLSFEEGNKIILLKYISFKEKSYTIQLSASTIPLLVLLEVERRK